MPYKIETLTSIAAAVVLFSISFATLWKIFKGSKSHFGYTIISFTFAEALRYLLLFLLL